MQAADLWNLDHVTEQGRLDGSAERCIFFERQMCTATFVVIEIVLEDSTQPGLMEDNDVVQAFAPNGTDEPFDIGILPRALRCSQDFVNAHPFRRLAEFLSVRAVAVAQEIPRRTIPRESLEKLTRRPFRSRVRGYREMHGTSALMVENHEDE